jgi:hypothetical protein
VWSQTASCGRDITRKDFTSWKRINSSTLHGMTKIGTPWGFLKTQHKRENEINLKSFVFFHKIP